MRCNRVAASHAGRPALQGLNYTGPFRIRAKSDRTIAVIRISAQWMRAHDNYRTLHCSSHMRKAAIRPHKQVTGLNSRSYLP